MKSLTSNERAQRKKKKEPKIAKKGWEMSENHQVASMEAFRSFEMEAIEEEYDHAHQL